MTRACNDHTFEWVLFNRALSWYFAIHDKPLCAPWRLHPNLWGSIGSVPSYNSQYKLQTIKFSKILNNTQMTEQQKEYLEVIVVFCHWLLNLNFYFEIEVQQPRSRTLGYILYPSPPTNVPTTTKTLLQKTGPRAQYFVVTPWIEPPCTPYDKAWSVWWWANGEHASTHTRARHGPNNKLNYCEH